MIESVVLDRTDIDCLSTRRNKHLNDTSCDPVNKIETRAKPAMHLIVTIS